MRTGGRGERGVALLIVLLVVAAAMALAAALMLDGLRDMRATSAWLGGEQAMLYARGGEAWAGELLYQDRQADLADGVWRDGRAETWATPLSDFDVDQGKLDIRIVDLQGRFNINNVRADDGTIDKTQAKVLQRLLSELDIDPGCNDKILDALDADSETRLEGAEDRELLEADPPHLAANRPFADIREVASVCNLDPEQMRRLRRDMTALPEHTLININSASADVLQALAPDLGATVGRITRDQTSVSYSNVEKALEQTGTVAALGAVHSQLTTGSSWFEVDVVAHYDKRVARLRSVIYRDKATGRPTVRRRGKSADLALDTQ